jgi:hypothetical protein
MLLIPKVTAFDIDHNKSKTKNCSKSLDDVDILVTLKYHTTYH